MFCLFLHLFLFSIDPRAYTGPLNLPIRVYYVRGYALLATSSSSSLLPGSRTVLVILVVILFFKSYYNTSVKQSSRDFKIWEVRSTSFVFPLWDAECQVVRHANTYLFHPADIVP